MDSMNKRERLEATIAGEAVDRPAVALWRHFPGDDQRAADLAAAHVWWQQTYDFDLLKVTPASSYCTQDWGVEIEWRGGDEGTSAYRNHIIDRPEDWLRLPLLDPNRGWLAMAREAARLTCQALGPDVPVIMTVFSPLAQARHLAGPNLLPHLREHPEAVLAGFEVVTESIIRFVESLAGTGVAGIYYAAQWADPVHLNREEYSRFGKAFDLRILEAAGGYWFNMLHAHGLGVYLDMFSDYPVQAVNWHDREAGPSLAEAAAILPQALSGGLDRWTVHHGTPDDVRREAADALDQTGGRRLILSTGCVTMTNSPLSNLRAVVR